MSDRKIIYLDDAIDALDCINGVEEVLRALPSAQPEIIQCKDCKYWREYKCAKETKRYIHFVDSMLSMQNQMIFAVEQKGGKNE